MRAAIKAFAVMVCAAGSMDASDLVAQSIPSAYRFVDERQEVGFFAGYLSAATGRFGYGPTGGLWGGARYGLELTGPLSLEGVAGAVQGTRDVINPRRPEGDRVVGEGDAVIATIDARLKLSLVGRRSWHRLSPFLLAGGGVAWDVSPAPEANAQLEADEVYDFGPSFFGTFGVGSRWYISNRFTLRTDALFSLWKLSTPVGFADPSIGLGPIPEGEWVRGLSITGGLLFRW